MFLDIRNCVSAVDEYLDGEERRSMHIICSPCQLHFAETTINKTKLCIIRPYSVEGLDPKIYFKAEDKEKAESLFNKLSIAFKANQDLIIDALEEGSL